MRLASCGVAEAEDRDARQEVYFVTFSRTLAVDTAFGLRPCLVTWAVLVYLVVASPCAFLVFPLLSGRGPGLAPLARCSGRPCRCSVVIELGAAQSHCGRRLSRVCAGRRPLAAGRAQPRPHQPRRPHDQRGDPRGSSPTVLHFLCSCLPLRAFSFHCLKDWEGLPSWTELRPLQQRRVRSLVLAQGRAA